MSKRILGFAAALAVLLPSIAFGGDIAPYGRGSFSSIRQAHAGRPLIVHFWSVTCAPCIHEMPRLADAARASRDFDLVLVSTDSIDQTPRIASRLKRYGFGDAASFAYADDFEERLRFEVDKGWRGELPFTALVKADGATSTVTGELEPAVLQDWLASAKQP